MDTIVLMEHVIIIIFAGSSSSLFWYLIEQRKVFPSRKICGSNLMMRSLSPGSDTLIIQEGWQVDLPD